MKLVEHLSKKQKQRLRKIKQEHLSRKDWEEIMGMNRDRYTRKNGAWRRK